MIHDFAPALRTNSQAEAFRIALQILGDMCGFGIQYFDYDKGSGYLKTATEVASDNSALLRNIRSHENALESALRAPVWADGFGLHVAAYGAGKTRPKPGNVSGCAWLWPAVPGGR